MKTIGAILFFGGLVVFCLNTIGSIGYGLFLWSEEELTFAKSVWSAFKMWIMLGIGSIISCIVGKILVE